MVHLLIVVMSIVLLAIVVTGGSNYLSVDKGLRVAAAGRIETSLQIVDSAFRSYRSANRGALPTVDGASVETGLWVAELAAYLPDERLPKLDGFEWSYGVQGARKFLCLSAIEPGEPAVAGMREAAGKLGFALEACRDELPSVGKYLN